MKRVTFNDCVEVNYMIAWGFAYRRCRMKYWENYAIDRFRFLRRIRSFEKKFLEIEKHSQIF